MGAAIIPWSPDFFPLLDRADGFLPVIGCFDCATFNDAPAGKANETRLQISKHLRQIGTQTVWPAMEGPGREKRNHVEPDFAVAASKDNKSGVRFVPRSGECGSEVFPMSADAFDRFGIAARDSISRLELDSKRSVEPIGAMCPE